MKKREKIKISKSPIYISFYHSKPEDHMGGESVTCDMVHGFKSWETKTSGVTDKREKEIQVHPGNKSRVNVHSCTL